jgi:AraC family transcriptional regulator
MSRSASPTPSSSRIRVYDALLAAGARLEREALIGDGMRIAQWENRDDETHYRRPGHHTVSVYLAGGLGTFRTDRPHEYGAPGRVCVMPAEHESRWVVQGPLRFVHLYVPEELWAERVLRAYDIEPRSLPLDERLFVEDPALAQWAVQLARMDWTDTDAVFAANATSHDVLDRLTAQIDPAHVARKRPRGGLAPAVRRRVIEIIEARLDLPLSLGQLAAEAALSEFHFARMFRTSMGCSPHAWIARRRLVRARELLAGGSLGLEAIAAACGFASASHLIQRFRAAFGVTPAQYRSLFSQR